MNKIYSLHWAVNNSHVSCVLALLKFGASKNLRTKDGKLPSDFSKKSEITQALEGREFFGWE